MQVSMLKLEPQKSLRMTYHDAGKQIHNRINDLKQKYRINSEGRMTVPATAEVEVVVANAALRRLQRHLTPSIHGVWAWSLQ